MATPNSQRALDLVAEAMLRPRTERPDYIRQSCPDPEAAAEALNMLAALERAGAFAGPPSTPDPAAAPGTVIGRYTILASLGEGGFGEVFLAEQREPVQRRVALKIIKAGMDTRQVIARFEAERQALAMMDDPHIAKVLDAGATHSGRPYFVMELVKGVPITAYCDANRLTIPDRLELFTQVCRAVQHAHTKGVIHRDIKPGNILVESHDGRALARVIDFGIAKATDRRLSDKTFFTEFRQFIGTPQYMSPEQAGGGLDVDTRSDVYSLGVLLYELLTGSTPFDPASLRAAAYEEVQRIIREQDPPRPSTRLSSLRDSIAGVAAHRGIEPARLNSLIRGELDWIAMKALEKDRSRRYGSPSDLAEDLRRYLAGEIIAAAPPSAAYRCRKLLRRHRVGFTAGALVALALIAGLIAALWQAGIAARERDSANLRRKETEQVAEFQATQLRGLDPQVMGARLRDDLLDSFKHATLADPADSNLKQFNQLLSSTNLTDVSVSVLNRHIFSRAIAAANDRFQDQPNIRAGLLLTISQSMMDLGLLEGAEPPLAEAMAIRRAQLGDDHPATLRNAAVMGGLIARRGRLGEARELLDATLARARAVLDPNDPIIGDVLTNLGFVRAAQGRVIESETLFRDALAIRRATPHPDGPRLVAAFANLGVSLGAQGKHEEAESTWRQAFELSARVNGPDHHDTLKSQSNYGNTLRLLDKTREAEPLVREAASRYRSLLGNSHPDTLNALFILGLTLENLGTQANLAEAESLFVEVLDTRRRTLGDRHQDTLQSMYILGQLRLAQSRPADAEPLFREAIAGHESNGAGNTPVAVSARFELGRTLAQLRQFQEAESVLLHVSRVLAAGHGGAGAGRGTSGQDPCANDLVALYTAWDTAEPGKGYDAKAQEWRAKLAP